MHIFLSILQSPHRHPIPSYDFWWPYFKKGIEESTHSWVEGKGLDWAGGLLYGVDDPRLETWRQQTWSRAIDEIANCHRQRSIDLFLSYLYPKQVSPEAVAQIQAMGIPCINFFCDNIREYHTIPDEFSVFDLNWVPEKAALTLYEQRGFPHIHLPMPMWVEPKLRTVSEKENYGVTFIGSKDAQREALFAEAIRLGADIELRGKGWGGSEAETEAEENISKASTQSIAQRPLPILLKRQYQFIQEQGVTAFWRKMTARLRKPQPDAIFEPFIQPAPSNAEYINMCQQCRIFLGVTRYPSFRYPFSKPNTYARLREIEAPMLGACYLTEWAEELEDLYEIGQEIETYRDAEEMVEKIKRLEADPALRRQLRISGQKRALNEHNIGHSLEKIIQRLFS